MKKLLALIMALCLLFTFAACGGGDTADNGDDSNNAEAVNLADFAGVWKISQGDVEFVEISGDAVTAYTADGKKIGTFPVVATSAGAVLKMGAAGEVTLEDATKLTVSAIPALTENIDVVGTWNFVYGTMPSDTVMVLSNDDTFKQTGEKEDSGSWFYKDKNFINLAPTKQLFSDNEYEILGAGQVLYHDGFQWIFVKADANDIGKAAGYQVILTIGEWKATDDENFTVEFKDNGKVLVSGAEMGIWYPTATGATVEYSDGNSDDLSYADGQFSLNYYGKTFASK